MKKLGIILLMFYFFISIISASVEVHDHTFKTSYYDYENISGEINLTITNENYNSELHSEDSERLPLGNFLTTNGIGYQCSPPDCSEDYNFHSASTDKTSSIDSETIYRGFILSGSNIVLTNLDFSIESNFETSERNPLSINFFDDDTWKFNKFSNVLSSKFWGCYKPDIPLVGPLVGTSSYCEMISISDTGALNVGAYVDNGDNKILNMKVYPEHGGGYLGKCNYNPNIQDGCKIDAEEGQIFETGKYQVCVSSNNLTNYHIYEEYSEDNCGFVYSLGPESSVKDYAIFAQTTKYSDASSFSSTDIDLTEATSIADNLLKTRYNRDCSDGCILPLKISGNPQELRIYDITLQYTKNGENYQEKNIYNLELIPTTIDFSGIIDLSLTKFNILESGPYSLYLGENKLFEENVEKIPSPIINSLSPLNPPAGVPVEFYVNVNYDIPNASLIYKWDFGGKSYTTKTNYVVHTFVELKNYTINIEVIADKNLTSTKNFVVNTISPAEAINSTLSEKEESINNVIKKIETLPNWYQEALKIAIDLTKYKDELKKIKNSQINAIEDKDFLTIAKDLYSLDIPVDIFSSEDKYPFLWTKTRDINPQIISDIEENSNYDNLDEYRDPILNWQTQNIQGSFSTKLFSVSKWNGNVIPILRIYSFNINSLTDDESYFVINHPREKIFFNNLPETKKSNEATAILLNKNSNKSFEFYYESSDETTFFISPKLSKIVIEKDIDTTCNFNYICEKNLGETSTTCRNDCKPITGAIIRGTLILIIILVIYTILQLWYKRNYEHYLFNNRQELYNLLMYITNARARGQTDKVIITALKKQKWSNEKITYAIKKSHGQQTGMMEIIPFDKITTYLRNRKAKRKIATPAQQQNQRNINKSNFQNRL